MTRVTTIDFPVDLPVVRRRDHWVARAGERELRLVNLELRAGKPRAEALRNLGERSGVDDLNSLVAMLIQTDKFGTSVAQSLRVYSETLRTKRRQRAEEAAAKTGVKMVFPLVFCILPAMVLAGPTIGGLTRPQTDVLEMLRRDALANPPDDPRNDPIWTYKLFEREFERNR